MTPTLNTPTRNNYDDLRQRRLPTQPFSACTDLEDSDVAASASVQGQQSEWAFNPQYRPGGRAKDLQNARDGSLSPSAPSEALSAPAESIVDMNVDQGRSFNSRALSGPGTLPGACDRHTSIIEESRNQNHTPRANASEGSEKLELEEALPFVQENAPGSLPQEPAPLLGTRPDVCTAPYCPVPAVELDGHAGAVVSATGDPCASPGHVATRADATACGHPGGAIAALASHGREASERPQGHQVCHLTTAESTSGAWPSPSDPDAFISATSGGKSSGFNPGLGLHAGGPVAGSAAGDVRNERGIATSSTPDVPITASISLAAGRPECSRPPGRPTFGAVVWDIVSSLSGLHRTAAAQDAANSTSTFEQAGGAAADGNLTSGPLSWPPVPDGYVPPDLSDDEDGPLSGLIAQGLIGEDSTGFALVELFPRSHSNGAETGGPIDHPVFASVPVDPPPASQEGRPPPLRGAGTIVTATQEPDSRLTRRQAMTEQAAHYLRLASMLTARGIEVWSLDVPGPNLPGAAGPLLPGHQGFQWMDGTGDGLELMRLSVYNSGLEERQVLYYRDGRVVELSDLFGDGYGSGPSANGSLSSPPDDDSTVSTTESAIPDEEWERIKSMRQAGTAFCYTSIAKREEDQRNLASLDANPTLETLFGSERTWRMHSSGLLVDSFYLTRVRGNWHLTRGKFRRYSKRYNTSAMFTEAGVAPEGLTAHDWSRRTVGSSGAGGDDGTLLGDADTHAPAAAIGTSPRETQCALRTELPTDYRFVMLRALQTTRIKAYLDSWALYMKSIVPGYCYLAAFDTDPKLGRYPSYLAFLALVADSQSIKGWRVVGGRTKHLSRWVGEPLSDVLDRFFHDPTALEFHGSIGGSPTASGMAQFLAGRWWYLYAAVICRLATLLVLGVHKPTGVDFWLLVAAAAYIGGGMLLDTLMTCGVAFAYSSIVALLATDSWVAWVVAIAFFYDTSWLFTESLASVPGYCYVLYAPFESAWVLGPWPTYGELKSHLDRECAYKKVGFKTWHCVPPGQGCGTPEDTDLVGGQLTLKWLKRLADGEGGACPSSSLTTCSAEDSPGPPGPSWDTVYDAMVWPPVLLLLIAAYGCWHGFPLLAAATVIVLATRIAFSKKSIGIAPMGSNGDFLPVREWASLLSSRYDIPAEVLECMDPSTGKDMLNHMEQGQLAWGAPHLADYIENLTRLSKDDCFVLGPAGGMGVCDGTYTLSPPMSDLNSFNVCPNPGPVGTILNAAGYLALCLGDWGVDLRIGYSPYSAPRLMNGSVLRRTHDRDMTGSGLLCLGSSIEQEPSEDELRALYPEVVEWFSTRPDSWATHEGSTDHVALFPQFDVIVTHGGAGTMAVALASGARAVSLSDMIDRSYKDGAVYHFTDCTDLYLHPYLGRMPLWMVWRAILNANRPLTMALVAVRKVSRHIAHLYVILHLSLAPTIFAIRDGHLSLYAGLPGFTLRATLLVGFILVLKLFLTIRQVTPAQALQAIAGVVLAVCVAVVEACYQTPAPILTYLARFDWIGKALFSVLSQQINYWVMIPLIRIVGQALSSFSSRPGKLSLEFVRIGSKHVWFLPAYHVRLAHPDGRNIAVTVEDDVVRCRVNENDRREVVTWVFTTGIDSDDYDTLRSRMREMHGKPYHPFSNCQTSVLGAIWPWSNWSAVALLSGLVLLSLTLTSTFLAVGICLAAIVFIATGQLISPATAGMSLIFHAGREDGPRDWGAVSRYLFGSGARQAKPSKKDSGGRLTVSGKTLLVKQGVAVSKVLAGAFDNVVAGELAKDTAVDYADGKAVLYVQDGSATEETEFLLSQVPSPSAVKEAIVAPSFLSSKSTRLTTANDGPIVVFTRPGAKVSSDFDGVQVRLKVFNEAMDCVEKVGLVTLKGNTLINGYDLKEHSRKSPTIVKRADGYYIGNLRLPMAMLTHVTGFKLVDDLLYHMRTNTGTFVKKVNAFMNNSLNDMSDTGLCQQTANWVRVLRRAVEPFQPAGQRKKGAHAWAGPPMPVRNNFINVNEEPRFHSADFNTTMAKYIQQVNGAGGVFETPVQFARRVRSNPYIDPVLGRVFQDHVEGMDGYDIACKELMIASLASYNKGTIVDALTDERMEDIASTIFKRRPELYTDARMPDPHKLVRKYLSLGSYSAGIPFMGDSSLRTRKDLRRNGWTQPLVTLATEALRTGDYFPSLFHAFPKSQIVKLSKLRDNPAKLRSITGASPIVMLQSHMVNWDQNNRHDPSSMGKPGIPLNGDALSRVFSDMAKWQSVISLDGNAFDRELASQTLGIVRRLREKGYDDSPFGNAMKAHLAALYQRTTQGYIINLISKPMSKVDHPLLKEVSPAVLEEIRAVSQAHAEPSSMAPGGVVTKVKGGATGDSDVTFNNTHALQAVLIDAIEATHDEITFDNIWEKLDIANFSDDNMVGYDGEIDWPRVFSYAKRVHNTQFRIESSGNTIFDQTFLAKRPRPASEYADEFERLGLELPSFAVVHDAETLKMRFSKYKQQAVANTVNPKRHAWYVRERTKGYLWLCAHQPDIYHAIRDYARNKLKELDPDMKPRFPSYDDIVRKWYKPKKELRWAPTAVRMKPVLASSFDTQLEAIMEGFDRFACALPSGELTVLDDAAPICDLSRSYNIFEDHAWCTFAKATGRAPTREEMKHVVKASPFCQFANIDVWYDSHADLMPTEGADLSYWADVATWKVVVYTAIYMATHQLVRMMHGIPIGALFAWFIRLYTTSMPRFFMSLSYIHYLGKGTVSGPIAGLIPKDSYSHHKRIACLVAEMLPSPELLALFPVSTLLEYAAIGCDLAATGLTLEMGTSSPKVMTSQTDNPWYKVAETVANWLREQSIVLTAATGTGKTKFMMWLLRVMMRMDVLLVLPRKILCEDQASKSKECLYKHRGVDEVASVMTCTYGYLAKVCENGDPAWLANRLVIFDEAHEWSPEWELLLSEFVPRHKVLMMTATPSDLLAGFPVVDAAIPPPFPIEIKEQKCDDLAAFSLQCMNKHDRALVVEPSTRKGDELVRRLRQSGVVVKHVHSADRSVPATGHVVATAIADAGLTIPGCDCVVDTGESIYNDGGTIRRLPSDPSTATQRAGRTGRTCPGTVYRLTKPQKPNIMRVCSLEDAVQGGRMALFYKIKADIDVNTTLPLRHRVVGDRYARFLNDPGAKLAELSLYHRLTLNGDPDHRYLSLRNGNATDDLFLLDEFGVQ